MKALRRSGELANVWIMQARQRSISYSQSPSVVGKETNGAFRKTNWNIDTHRYIHQLQAAYEEHLLRRSCLEMEAKVAEVTAIRADVADQKTETAHMAW